MTRLLLIGLVVLSVALGVAVAGDEDAAAPTDRIEARDLPHGLKGTYLITGEGEHNNLALVDPTIVQIGTRAFLRGKVSEDTSKLVGGTSVEFVGADAYMPLAVIQSIRQAKTE